MERTQADGRLGQAGLVLTQLGLLAALYLVAGWLGLSLAHYHDNASLFWPPTGLALAALILYGERLWPGVLVGALALSTARGEPAAVVVGIAIGNTLEAVVGAWLLRRAGFRTTFERVRDVIAFVAIGAFGCTLVSTLVGVGTLTLFGDLGLAHVGVVGLIWWLGDMGGALILTPLLLLARDGAPPWRVLLGSIEAWLIGGALLVSGVVAFGGSLEGPQALVAAFMPYPFLVWAGTRLGPRGAVSASLLVALVATLGTALGRGPFVFPGVHTQMLLLWSYAIGMGSVAITLAAAIAQREVAERRHLEEEVGRRRIESKLHQAQRVESLGLLAGGVAHDFNNILTVVLGHVRLLEPRLRDDAEGQERLRKIQVATGRAAELCRRLLDYAGRRRPVMRTLQLSELVDETCALAAPSVPKSIVLEKKAAAAPVVDGDPTLLRQVVMNLVLNAAEAIGDRAGAIAIEVGCGSLRAEDLALLVGANEATPGEFGFVEVRDTGAGMDDETRERIFDPFFTSKAEGRGLGLASVLGIARSHGGAIDVESEPGRGTRFRVYLPGAQPRPAAREADARRREISGEGRRVLVADDEPGVRELVSEVLASVGYRTVLAVDGSEAFERFAERVGDFDAVLLDLTMPRMGGLETLGAIRALDRKVPVLLMSGNEPQGDEGEAGASAYLRKPFTNEELVETLGRVIASVRN